MQGDIYRLFGQAKAFAGLTAASDTHIINSGPHDPGDIHNFLLNAQVRHGHDGRLIARCLYPGQIIKGQGQGNGLTGTGRGGHDTADSVVSGQRRISFNHGHFIDCRKEETEDFGLRLTTRRSMRIEIFFGMPVCSSRPVVLLKDLIGLFDNKLLDGVS